IHDNMIANFNIIDLEKTYTVSPDEFLSMGKSTPFENEILKGKVVQTIVNGKTVYKEGV
ncbi:MAG: dihydroorotase, partial [Peptostreptococcaceae bacterium]|nr:dihydroorotase [Peptostreptococcaceae bacterium]